MKHELERTPSMRWVTAEEVSKVAHLSPGTLANWRWRDLRAGRSGAALGQPVYRRIGRAVRYLVDAYGLPVMAGETPHAAAGTHGEPDSGFRMERHKGDQRRLRPGASSRWRPPE
ncbi:MAG: hypothetical protein ACUVXB_18060 [Bryobacteraceae bacterium]